MIEVRPFQLEDMSIENIREHEAEFLESIDEWRAAVTALKKKGSAWTLWIDDKAVCFGGVWFMWPGVCDLWLIPTKDLHRHFKTVAVEVRKKVDSFFALYPLHRMQSVSLNDSLHSRWHEFLGFKKESVLQKYGMGQQDYAMYVRFE